MDILLVTFLRNCLIIYSLVLCCSVQWWEYTHQSSEDGSHVDITNDHCVFELSCADLTDFLVYSVDEQGFYFILCTLL